MPLEKGFRAGGTIRPSRFVKISADSTVQECDAGDQCFAISQEWTRDTPVDVYTGTGVNAAIDGDQITLYGAADAGPLLEAGAAFSAGDVLKSDADGRGIVVTAITDESGAIALEESLAAGDMARVQVILSVNQ